MSSKVHRYPLTPKYSYTTDLPLELQETLTPHTGVRESVTTGECVLGKKEGWHYVFTKRNISSEHLYFKGALIETRKYNRDRKLIKVTTTNRKNNTAVLHDIDDYGRKLRTVPISKTRLMHGVYKEWDSRTGRLFLTATFTQGKLHGPLTVYHTNGNVKETCNITNFKRNGHLRVYHPSGELKLCREYINGKRLGWATVWNKEGKQLATTRTTRDGAWAVHGRHGTEKEISTTLHKFLQFVVNNTTFGSATSRSSFFSRYLNEKIATVAFQLDDSPTVAHHQV